MDKSKIFTKKNITYLMIAILAIQVLFVVWLNLFKCHDWIDHDASMLYSHTISMWEQKRYTLPYFQDDTFLNIDTTCIFAMPLYGLTHDIFLAYGISNIIFLIFTLWIMYDILKKLDVPDMYRYAAMLLYVIPYRMGMVQYTSMLFFEGSFYVVPIDIALIALDLFLAGKSDVEDKKGRITYYVMLALYIILTALTAFSRGTFVLLVALLPIIACYALDVILSPEGFSHIERSKVILITVTLVSYAAGTWYGKLRGIQPAVTGYALVETKDLFNNFVNVFWGHLSIFMRRGMKAVFSAEGIYQLILFAYAILMIIVLVFNIKNAFGDSKYARPLRYLTVVYVWNAVILGLTDCAQSDLVYPERYLFPGFVPLLLSVPVMLIYMEKIERKLLRGCAFLVVSALTLLTVGACDVFAVVDIRQNLEDVRGIKEVIAHARGEGIDTVFFINDDNAGLIARSLDPTLRVISVNLNQDGSYTFCGRENFFAARDRAFYGDENIMATKWSERPADLFKDYQISSYQEEGDVEDYHLYRAGSNKFDNMTGFPYNDNVLSKTTDFCHSYGYQILGDIDLYGYLETVGTDNYALLSPLLPAPYTDCNVTLTYEMGHKTSEDPTDFGSAGSAAVGKLMLLDGASQEISSVDIMPDSQSVTITAKAGVPCYVAVWLDTDVKITLCKLDFEVIQ